MEQSPTRDPYQLERLAEELESRENRDSHLPSQYHSLPQHVPLSHNDPHLTASEFDVEVFLLSRAHTPLNDLRGELRQYLAELKEELIKLINDDYEAFISLSTDLKDEGGRLEGLLNPLASIRNDVTITKRELEAVQEAIHAKLSERSRLRDAKTLLQLLLKISESVTRLESLLLIQLPEDDADDSIEKGSKYISYESRQDGPEDRHRGNRAKHLGRVSTEYTQLLYHVRKARAEDCAFVEGIQWRIDRIHSTLSSDLDHLFSETIGLLNETKTEQRGSELDRNKNLSDLTECLRTYDILGLWEDAEEVIRQELTICLGALSGPHSPLIPNTPFTFSSDSTHGFQIPYTPFTAFVPRQLGAVISGQPSQVELLDDTDDPLARLYNQLLRFVERDVYRLMKIADDIGSDTRDNSEAKSPVDIRPSKYQILSNVVWDEIGRSIMDEIGAQVFAAGKPNELRKSLELLAPSFQAVECMRRHGTYAAFQRKWQLPVYFQLRWKEIIGTLEESLSGSRLIYTSNQGNFTTSQSFATWVAISACWSSDVFIPELNHRFWKLTLQVLHRYSGWVKQALAAEESPVRPSGAVADKSATHASNTLTAGETVSSELSSADESLLRPYSSILIDIRELEANVTTLWRQVMNLMLPQSDTTEQQMFEDALHEATRGFTSLLPDLPHKIISILSRQCCEGLLPVRGIPSQFRAMSNKRNPTEPSYFVPSILRPVKLYFGIIGGGNIGSTLKDPYLQSFATEIFDQVSQRYTNYLTFMKKTEESLRRLKKGKKPTLSIFGAGGDDFKDEERIRLQMILDVEAFGEDARSLGVDVDGNQHFLALKGVIHAAEDD
ncbi:hypothetical protein CVT24_009415 [Panaeolus cyanescens]|uniref:Conserved oligomeric Golgi complex subunit 2 n=1 Tax=Panaeolus cyanescens TaxID=181874 RepID=A0A409VAQ9_9AGAR|nr:hypothetical protein CVT24_009415 [Panaeolus cyanescens]